MAYLIHLLTLLFILSLAALAQGLMVGYAGIVFVGTAGFMGVGAYTSAFLADSAHLPVPVAMVAAAMVCALCGCIICLLLRNMRKDYLALATLGVGLILYDVFNNATAWTNGPMGLPGLPSVVATQGGNLVNLLIIISLATVFLLAVGRSRFGCLLRAIRDDEELVESIGQSTLWPRAVVFALSFFLIGVSGAWFGHYLSFIDPSSFTLADSIAVLSMVIIGGAESHVGALLGAAVFILLPEGLRFLGLPPDMAAPVRQCLFGLMLVLLMILRPQGMLGKYQLR